ncbi:MAG TPA: gliding motility protein GldM, partial [Flavobacteriaceae bacterium]|nr:gliding motility protein GldM [Flavobacteriaceae bacterium]
MASIQELDARQRMINMMYIIFIAMQALNMSKEVLTAFGDVNQSLTTNIEQNEKQNQLLMAGLATRAEEQPEKYKPLHAKAIEIEKTSDDLVNYIQGLKTDLMEDTPRDDDGDLLYESMDNADNINQMFFADDQHTDRAKELQAKVEQFRDDAASLAIESGNEAMAADIRAKFNTDPVKTKDSGTLPWLNYNFEGFPLIAGITKLTNIQSNAKQVQSDLLGSLVSGQMASDVSMTNYEAIVVPDKTAFFSGENFTGKVVLGRFDSTLNFDEVTINGREVDDIQAGQVNLSFPAGNVGEQDIKGELHFKEGDSIVSIPVTSKYTVIPKPNQAVISADKMNVVYRGVQNPMTISIPGVSNATANAPGLTKTGTSSYMMTPGSGREVTINVSGKLPNGETVSDSQTFRIKDIPSPTGTVRGQVASGGPLKMQKNALNISTVGATLPDFDFDLNLSISGFKL